MPASDNTSRFSNRVEDYVKYRPGYPPEMLTCLQDQYGFRPGQSIADIGSGTGISSLYFLDAGYSVAGVEPNEPMRLKSEALLKDYPAFRALPGRAEATLLPGHSVDAVVAGQAFHWFDTVACRAEFVRILKPGSPLVLFWNERLTDPGFGAAYDALIVRHAIDYVQVDHRNVDLPHIQAFFAPQSCALHEFANKQVFDLEGLNGRLSSSSYMPQSGSPGYDAMKADLEQLFGQYNRDGKVQIDYTTKMYAGYLK